MNVIGSRPTGWWRDRDGAVVRLVEGLRALADADRIDVTVIVDGRPIEGLGEGTHGRAEVLYAPGGRNAADDRIVALLEAHDDPSSLEVVTADRNLRERAEARGARVSGPSALLARIDRAAG